MLSRVSRCSTGQPDGEVQYLNGRNINEIWCTADDPPVLAARPFRGYLPPPNEIELSMSDHLNHLRICFLENALRSSLKAVG